MCLFQDSVGLFSELSCETGRDFCCCNPHSFLQPEVLRLYFPALELWAVRSVLLPSCSSWFICTQMWYCPVSQPPPCLPWSFISNCLAMSPLCPSYPSPPLLPLLPVWTNVSLTPWLLDFHTVDFLAILVIFCFQICCSFHCARRQSVSTCASILVGGLLGVKLESLNVKSRRNFVVWVGLLNLSVPHLKINNTCAIWLLQGLNEINYSLINLTIIY